MITSEQLREARTSLASLEEADIAAWWNEQRNNACWNGAITGYEWDQLWEQAKQNLRAVYRSSSVYLVSGND